MRRLLPAMGLIVLVLGACGAVDKDPDCLPTRGGGAPGDPCVSDARPASRDAAPRSGAHSVASNAATTA